MNKKNKSIIVADTNPNNDLVERIIEINKNKGYVLPSKQNIILLLNNPEVKKVFQFCVEKFEQYQTKKKIKEKIHFYKLYQDKISLLYEQNKKKETLLKILEEKKELLNKIKQQKKELSESNTNMLHVINDNQKEELLSDIKNKIISIATTPMNNLLNSFDKFQFIENFKYDHCYFGKNKHNEPISEKENEKGNFNIMNYINEAASHISLINQSSLLQQSNMTNTSNNSNNNQLVPLPKLSPEDIVKYTQLTQEDFFDQINQILKLLTLITGDKKDNALTLSLSSVQSKNTSVIDKEKQEENKKIFKKIIQNFTEELQKEEKEISALFNKNKKIDLISEISKENAQLIKAYHISPKIVQIINDIVRKKLAKDIVNEYHKCEDSIEEFSLPKCFIDKDTNDKIMFYHNVMRTYKRFVLRTDNFINKRLFPLGLMLEEKYTDFINTIQTEFDYFIKLQLKHLKQNQGDINLQQNKYSLSKFKYDKLILSSLNISSKYDVFSLFFKYYYQLDKIEKQREKNKIETDSIYTNSDYLSYIQIFENCIPQIEKFLNDFNFNQEYKLFPNDNLVNETRLLFNEYKNINHIIYSDK